MKRFLTVMIVAALLVLLYGSKLQQWMTAEDDLSVIAEVGGVTTLRKISPEILWGGESASTDSAVSALYGVDALENLEMCGLYNPPELEEFEIVGLLTYRDFEEYLYSGLSAEFLEQVNASYFTWEMLDRPPECIRQFDVYLAPSDTWAEDVALFEFVVDGIRFVTVSPFPSDYEHDFPDLEVGLIPGHPYDLVDQFAVAQMRRGTWGR